MTGSIKSPVEDCKERVEHYQKKRSDGGRLDLESMDKACWREIWWCKKDQNCSLNLLYVVRVARLPLVLDPPPHLLDLYTSSCNNIRAYNGLLACSSFGTNIDENF